MHKFLHSPLFRCLICLILISCILVNCSPIRADAFGAGAAVTAIVGSAAAVTVVAGIMMALGVMPDSANTAAFETVVNGCTSALTSSGVFLNGLVTVLQLSDHDLTNNYVNQGIVEAILDWLFESGTVNVNKGVATDGYAYYNGHLLPDLPVSLSTNKVVLRSSGSSIVCSYVSGGSSGWMYDPSESRIVPANSGYSYYYSGGSWSDRSIFSPSSGDFASSYLIWSNTDIKYSTDSSLIYFEAIDPSSTLVDTTIATGLIAGQIGTDIETDYETWVQDGVVAVDFGIGYVDDPNTENDDDDDDEGDTEIGPSNPKDPVTPENPAQPSTSPSPWWKNNKWLNVGGGIVGWELGKLTNALLDQTQNGIQTGYGDPEYKVDTSLFDNGGNGTNNWSGSDPSIPSDPGNPDVPAPVPEISPYALDLKDFFPFCIPFDIYDFFSALIAPPEAPVFVWELKDLSGRTYSIVVDLSCWDQLAEVFRSMQLLLFIVGLAVASRKFIKW